MSEWLLWFSTAQARVIVSAGASAFFIGLTLYCVLRKENRRYVPATVLIFLGCLSGLIGNVFAPNLSPHPLLIGGMWRLANGLVVFAGAVMYQRAYSRAKRERPR
jgi:hypothetical protein